MSDTSKCPTCGYTKRDAQMHMDHHLCKNDGNAPWQKPAPDTRHAEASQPASCAHPYTHAEEVIGEEVGVIRESYTVCSKCGKRISPKVQSTPQNGVVVRDGIPTFYQKTVDQAKPAPEPTVLPWMKAAAADLYDYFVMGGGHSGDDTAIAIIAAHAPAPAVRDAAVDFYEREFYVLSNFASFKLYWRGLSFYTSEVAYHWEKFPHDTLVQDSLLSARSSHDAFKIAERHKGVVRSDWKDVRVGIMRDILTAKANQHEYVRRKLLETGNRLLIENSWRDDFWGVGPNGNGQNQMGKLWMEVRASIARVKGTKEENHV